MTSTSNKNMKILIIGGTSFFGKQIVIKLIEQGHDVTVLSRGNTQPKEFWDKVSHITCDRTNREDFYAKLKDTQFDIVIDNLVFDDEDAKSIIETFANQANPPHYIFCSSSAVYDQLPYNGIPYKEDDTPLTQLDVSHEWDAFGRIKYGNAKRAAENYFKQHHGKLNYTAIRPTVVEGPEDPSGRTWFWIQRILDQGPILIPKHHQKSLYRNVFVDDVVQAFLLCVNNPDAYNQAFNVAGNDIMTLEQYLQKLSAELKQPMPELCYMSREKINTIIPNYYLPNFFEDARVIPDIDKISKQLAYQPVSTNKYFSNIAITHEKASLGYQNRELEIHACSRHN